MNRIKKMIAVLCVMVSSVTHAQPSPVPMLEQSSNQIIAMLKQNQSSLKSDHHIVYQAIQRYLLPHVDLNGMSRSVLGRQAWQQATHAEQQAFTEAFTQLVIRTYANPLTDYSGETVMFLPLRASVEARFIRVNSVISRPNGQTIPLTYNLVANHGDWKIYDLSVEGVSLLQSFRSQFGDLLKNASMHDLIMQMHHTQQAAS